MFLLYNNLQKQQNHARYNPIKTPYHNSIATKSQHKPKSKGKSSSSDSDRVVDDYNIHHTVQVVDDYSIWLHHILHHTVHVADDFNILLHHTVHVVKGDEFFDVFPVGASQKLVAHQNRQLRSHACQRNMYQPVISL